MATIQPTPAQTEASRTSGDDHNARLHDGEKSLPTLIEDAIGHAAGLMRDEVRLARSELMDGMKTMRGGAVSLGVGVALLLPGITLLLYAAAVALQSSGLDLWLAATIVGIGAAVLGMIFMMMGKSKMDPQNLSAPRATEDVKRTASLAKEQSQ